MPKDKTTDCYVGLISKLNRIENQINKMHQGISELKLKLSEELDPNEEICIDAIESDLALLESIEDMCLTALLDREPEGDA